MKLILKIAAGVVLAVVVLTVGCSALVAKSLDTSTPSSVGSTDGPVDALADAVTGKSNAQRSAENYLDLSAFSRSGLAEQLEFEGYTPAQAQYGVSVAYR